MLLTLAFAPEAHPKECVIISGMNRDWNGAFKEEHLGKDRDFINGFQCKTVNSWKEADDYILTLKKGEQLLIIQESHGGSGGSALCNAGDVEPDEILSYMNKYQKKFQVGVIMNSCFSADLIKKKLAMDANQGHQKELENLCIVAASPFGKEAFGTISDWTLNPGDNLEMVALRQPRVTITSSAWDSSGITRFILHSNGKKASKALRKLDRIASREKDCVFDPEDKSNAKLLAKYCEEGVPADLFNELALLDKDTIPDILRELRKKLLDKVDPPLPNDGGPRPKPLEGVAKKCVEAFLEKSKAIEPEWVFNKELKFHNVFPKGLRTGNLFWDTMKEFVASKEYQPCRDYQGKVFTPPFQNQLNPQSSELTTVTFTSSEQVDDLLGFTVKSNEQDPGSEVRVKLLKQKAEQEKIRGLFNKEDLDDLTLKTLPKYLKESSGECKARILKHDPEKTLNAILGSNLLWPIDGEDGRSEFSPTHLLEAFRNGSAEIEELKSKRDRWRRKACRDFKF